MKKRYPRLEVHSFEVKKNRDNATLFAQISNIYGLNIKGVPAAFVGGLSPVMGFQGDDTSGGEIENNIRYCIDNPCNDPMNRLSKNAFPGMGFGQDNTAIQEGLCKEDAECPDEPAIGNKKNLITLPLIGTIDSAKTALSYQTFIIAGLDSFNPCAFFVLFTLL